MLLVLSCK